MELVKNGASTPVLKIDGDIKFDQVGNNLSMSVRAYVTAPDGKKQVIGYARFDYVDPQILRSLLKFAEEGRQRQYGQVLVTG